MLHLRARRHIGSLACNGIKPVMIVVKFIENHPTPNEY
jgi:hypothetical protein